jgi:GTPase SAR1 family protein
MSDAPVRISLTLLSHTNVGKTTLARTLLRRDIGAVMDRPHVTEVAESHVLLRTPADDELVLWDTPGFGDSVRLLRRLEQGTQPIGWFLSQVWDRLADRPFWCSQQALRAARDAADVLLYVANATEDPGAAGYVEPELQILRWLDKPTLVLLNQLGTHPDPQRDAETERLWREVLRTQLADRPYEVLAFDAFARCWLQEHVLLEAIESVLVPGQRSGWARLRQAWARRDRQVLADSARVIARQWRRLATDSETVPAPSLPDKLRLAARSLGAAGESVGPAEERARIALSHRLDAAVRESTDELVRLHGLAGGAGEQILARFGREIAIERAPDPDRAGLLGGIVSGALGGLAADVAAGGLTLGAGAVIGGVVGALGVRKFTQLYNAERGLDGSVVRWSQDFLRARLEAALVRYLAVAHYGRGRGEFRDAPPDPRWSEVARATLAACAVDPTMLADIEEDATHDALAEVVSKLLLDMLRRLYPQAMTAFESADPPS